MSQACLDYPDVKADDARTGPNVRPLDGKGTGVDDMNLPPPPEKPDPMDCCGGGCAPCILDAYEDALEEWRRIVSARVSAHRAPRG
jgi:hypothetical protein